MCSMRMSRFCDGRVLTFVTRWPQSGTRSTSVATWVSRTRTERAAPDLLLLDAALGGPTSMTSQRSANNWRSPPRRWGRAGPEDGGRWNRAVWRQAGETFVGRPDLWSQLVASR